MIADLKPYPTMKDSGVKWLGKVPAHWNVRRIKSLSAVKRGASPRPIADPKFFDERGEYVWVRISDVTASNQYLESTTQRLSELGQSLSVLLQPGSLFLSIAGSVGKPIITKIKCCIHDGFVYFPNFRGNVKFLYRTLSCDAPFANLGKFGTQLNLNTDTVGNIVLGWPTLSEQTAIARFLDHMDRRIQKYIRAKEKLIASLDEHKQAIIHQAVTGQIDVRTGQPYPAYKASGMEWLGRVPGHWDVRRLGQIGKLSKGNGGNKEDEMSSGVPCVRYGDLYTMHTYFILESRSFVSKANAEDYTPINFGDVLFAASGETIDEIGKSAVNLMQSAACCGGDIILFRPERRFEARYLGYATDCRSAVAQKASMGRGFTVIHIYGSSLKYLSLPLPSDSEQTAIAEYLDRATADIDTTIAQSRRQVGLFTEYRTRLIADVVTGKLDVREAAAALPEIDPLAAEDTPDGTLDTDAV